MARSHWTGPINSTNGFETPSGGTDSHASGSIFEMLTGSIRKLVSTSHTVTAQEKQSYWVSIPLAGVVATTGGAVGALLNPEGVAVIVGHVILYKTTASTGAATLDIGIGATVTTSNDTLLDGITAQTTVIADNITDIGTNGKPRQILGATSAITVTGSADTTGLVGKLLVEIIIP